MDVGWFMIIYFFFVYFLCGYREGNNSSRIPWKVIYGMIAFMIIISLKYLYLGWNQLISPIHSFNNLILMIILTFIAIFSYLITFAIGHWVGQKVYYHHLDIGKGKIL